MKHLNQLSIIILVLIILSACAQRSTLSSVPTAASLPGASVPQKAVPTLPKPAAGSDKAADIWAANPADHTVLRISPNTNSVIARVQVDGSPETVTAGVDGVWVLDRPHNLVFRIDPSTNQVTTSVHLPSGKAAAMVAGAGAIWVGMTGEIDLTNQTPGQVEEIVPPGMVIQIDPKTNKIANQYSIQPVSRLALSGSALWILSRSIIDTPIQVIDLGSKQGMSMPFHNAPDWLPADALAADSTNLWLFSSAYGKIFRATLDGRIDSSITLDERQPTGYADLLLYGSSLWAATPWGTVLRIDPLTNHILANIDIGVPLTELIAGDDTLTGNAVWALSQQSATLFRIDPTSNSIIAQIKMGSLLEPTVVPSPTPRIVVWKPCPDAATSRLKIGDLAYVTKDPPVPNRIRKEPNTDAEILGYITPGGSMEITDGPTCANGWVWWQVKNADLNGWTSEGDKETYWLIPLYK